MKNGCTVVHAFKLYFSQPNLHLVWFFTLKLHIACTSHAVVYTEIVK